MTKIVVIEDNDSIREELAEILRFEGFDVASAENGRTGLEAVRRETPDVILCDLMMPEVDGYETLNAVRSDPATATIPFVCLTARTERSDVRRAMELGADDYITKPFSVDDVLRGIGAAVERRARSRAAADAKLDEMRDQLSSILPHEFRTPLSVVLGYAEMLDDPESPPDADEVRFAAHQILDAGMRLKRMTENILLHAQLGALAEEAEDGRAAPSLDARSAVERIARACARAHHRADDLHLELASASVRLPTEHFAKLVEELVDNAFKFSPAGAPVDVELRRAQERIVLRVRDRGVGMTAEQASRVAAWTQFDRELREQQGVGLGLAVASRIVQIAGGTLEIDGGPGRGTAVSVRLPEG